MNICFRNTLQAGGSIWDSHHSMSVRDGLRVALEKDFSMSSNLNNQNGI